MISGGTQLSKRGITSKKLSVSKVHSMKQFEIQKLNHLTDKGNDYNQVKLPEDEKKEENDGLLDEFTEQKEFEIQ